jgi:hypothetical protein
LVAGLLQAVGTILLFALLLALTGVVTVAVGGWVIGLTGLLVVIVALLWLAAWELTRVAVVVGERRNVFRAFGRAVGFVFHRSLSVALLYALSLVSWAALYLLYRWALVPRLPRAWWLLTFFLQQVFVALWLWIRLGRWAGDVVLYQGESLAPEPGI